jgi:hypothetical protein
MERRNSTDNWEEYGYFDNTNTVCSTYSDRNFDKKWKTARWFSILAVIFGVLGIRLANEDPKFISPMALLLAFFSQLMTFSFLTSDGCSEGLSSYYNISTTMIFSSWSGGCTRSHGANIGIAAAVLWATCCFIATILVCVNGIKFRNNEVEVESCCYNGIEFEGKEVISCSCCSCIEGSKKYCCCCYFLVGLYIPCRKHCCEGFSPVRYKKQNKTGYGTF